MSPGAGTFAFEAFPKSVALNAAVYAVTTSALLVSVKGRSDRSSVTCTDGCAFANSAISGAPNLHRTNPEPLMSVLGQKRALD